jgi:hypothetical protein
LLTQRPGALICTLSVLCCSAAAAAAFYVHMSTYVCLYPAEHCCSSQVVQCCAACADHCCFVYDCIGCGFTIQFVSSCQGLPCLACGLQLFCWVHVHDRECMSAAVFYAGCATKCATLHSAVQ